MSEEAAYAALLALFTTGALEGPQVIASDINVDRGTGRQLKDLLGDALPTAAQGLVQQSQSYGADSYAGKLGARMAEGLAAGQVPSDYRLGQLFNTLERASEAGTLPRGSETVEQATQAQKTASTGEAAEQDIDLGRTFESRSIPTYEELVAKRAIPVVDIREKPSGRMAEQRETFLNSDEALEILGQPLVNDDTGAAMFVTTKTFNHTFSNLGLDQVGAARKLREIIKTAVLTHSEPSRSAPRDNTTGVYTLFGAVRTEAGIQPVKLKVKEYRLVGQDIPKEIKAYFEQTGTEAATYAQNYDTRVLEVQSIEKGASSSVPTDAAGIAAVKHPSAPLEGVSSSVPREEATASTHKHPSTPSTISVADLLGLVKGDAVRYIPKPTAEGTAAPYGQETAESERIAPVEDAGTKERDLEPMSDEWLEDLLVNGEQGYVPRDARSAADIAVEQGVEELQGPPRQPRPATGLWVRTLKAFLTV